LHLPAPRFWCLSRDSPAGHLFLTTSVAGASAVGYFLRMTSKAMNYRVVHFEIHADQPERAIAFYFWMMQNDPAAK
jgi:hypothetical protein